MAEERRQKLKEALEAKGLCLRDDSVLCNRYIDDDKGNPEKIVEIMEEMDFYFKNTDYETIVHEEHENNNTRCSDKAKQKALKKYVLSKVHTRSIIPFPEIPKSLHTKVTQIIWFHQYGRHFQETINKWCVDNNVDYKLNYVHYKNFDEHSQWQRAFDAAKKEEKVS